MRQSAESSSACGQRSPTPLRPVVLSEGAAVRFVTTCITSSWCSAARPERKTDGNSSSRDVRTLGPQQQILLVEGRLSTRDPSARREKLRSRAAYADSEGGTLGRSAPTTESRRAFGTDAAAAMSRWPRSSRSAVSGARMKAASTPAKSVGSGGAPCSRTSTPIAASARALVLLSAATEAATAPRRAARPAVSAYPPARPRSSPGARAAASPPRAAATSSRERERVNPDESVPADTMSGGERIHTIKHARAFAGLMRREALALARKSNH